MLTLSYVWEKARNKQLKGYWQKEKLTPGIGKEGENA